MNTTTPPPATCNFGHPCSPDDFTTLIDGGEWIFVGECQQCLDLEHKAQRLQVEREGLDSYQHDERGVPKEYRLKKDGGRTDLDDADHKANWDKNRCSQWIGYLRNWDPVRHKWAGFVGGGGTGKSRMIGVYCRDLARKGRRILWVNGAQLAWNLKGGNGGWEDKAKSRFHINEMIKADVLVLDDLFKGANDRSAVYFDNLYHILEERNMHARTMLWTANTHPGSPDVANLMTADQREPIIGRLIENTYLGQV